MPLTDSRGLEISLLCNVMAVKEVVYYDYSRQ